MRVKAYSLMAAVGLWAGAAQAATVTWDGSTDTTWTQPDPTSWSGSTYSNNDTALFGDTGVGTVNVDAGGVTPAGTIISNNSGTYTFSGGSIGGTGTLIKAGSGSLVLGASNTFSGNVILSQGGITLNVVGVVALGAGSNVTVNGAVTFVGAYTFGGQPSTVYKGLTVNTGGNFTFSSPSAYYPLTFTGPVTGDGTITATGASSSHPLILPNTSNTFSGLFYANNSSYSGGFSVGSVGDGPSSIRLGNAAAFSLSSAAVQPLVFNSRRIELVGTTTGGTLNNNATSAANTFTVNTPLLITGAGNKTFTLGGSNTGTNRFAGAITNGSGSDISVTKADAGTWGLSGTNTYSGPTTISGGTLEIADAGCLGNGSYAGAIIISGTFKCSSSVTQACRGVVSGTGTLVRAGTGTLKLFGVNTYSGATMVTNGTLVGVVGGSCSNSAVTVTNALGVVATLGISVTNNTMQWTCASLAFRTNNAVAQMKFMFDGNVKPGLTMAPLNITGNLVFAGVPRVVVDTAYLSPGTYPLVTVGGTAPTNDVPTVSGVSGNLVWGGAGGRTLYMAVWTAGTVMMVR